MSIDPQNLAGARGSEPAPSKPRIPAVARTWILRALLISRQPAPGSVRRYACGIFKLDRLGDFILSIGAIRRLTTVFGEDRCVLVVSTLVQGLARRLFPKIRLISLPLIPAGLITGMVPYLFRYRRLFHDFSVDRLVCLRHHCHVGEELVLTWIQHQKSFVVANQPRFINPAGAPCFERTRGPSPPYPEEAPAGSCLELEAHRRLVEAALGEAVDLESVTPKLNAGVPPTPLRLLLCPFGSVRIRDYPVGSWVEVCRQLSPEVTIRICGAPSERTDLIAFCAAIQAVCQSTVEIAETPDLDSLTAEIARATVVAGVESAPAHLTTAMDRRGVFLIGGGHFGIFAPWTRSTRQVWLSHPLPCYHCSWDCSFDQSYCISRIPSEEVAKTINSFFALA